MLSLSLIAYISVFIKASWEVTKDLYVLEMEKIEITDMIGINIPTAIDEPIVIVEEKNNENNTEKPEKSINAINNNAQKIKLTFKYSDGFHARKFPDIVNGKIAKYKSNIKNIEKENIKFITIIESHFWNTICCLDIGFDNINNNVPSSISPRINLADLNPVKIEMKITMKATIAQNVFVSIIAPLTILIGFEDSLMYTRVKVTAKIIVDKTATPRIIHVDHEVSIFFIECLNINIYIFPSNNYSLINHIIF